MELITNCRLRKLQEECIGITQQYPVHDVAAAELRLKEVTTYHERTTGNLNNCAKCRYVFEERRNAYNSLVADNTNFNGLSIRSDRETRDHRFFGEIYL